ncbi:MAG: 7-cyano-7-deazaguanine synthase QueC [Clostridia bacterium]|nr:7-cyano-7-deazaguanine synthase QueC [Clostridia bacterium]
MGKVSEIRRDTFMKALVIFSGGLDSTTALYWAKAHYDAVKAVHFAYGSNHQQQEGNAAQAIADALKIELVKIPLDFIGKHFKSALLGGTIPDGQYEADNMSSTIVPFRNGIMLSIAAGLADSLGIDDVILGNHGGDHFIYPDCRPGFITDMNAAIQAGTDKAVQIVSPFCNMSKAGIVEMGALLGVDFSKTYSCYKGGAQHCGTCGTCLERKEAFKAAGVKDPTIYLN